MIHQGVYHNLFSVPDDALACQRLTTRSAQLIKCCEPLQKQRVSCNLPVIHYRPFQGDSSAVVQYFPSYTNKCFNVLRDFSFPFALRDIFTAFSKCHIGYTILRTLHLHAGMNITVMNIYEPPRGKTNNVVSEQVRHKPACTSTEKS